MNYVKDNIAKMPWESEGFLKNKYAGFVAAVHMYGKLPIIFDEQGIYTYYDSECPFTLRDTVKLIKSCYKKTGGKEPRLELKTDPRDFEEFVDLSDGYDADDEVCEAYGLSEEDIVDIRNRLADLSPYFS